MLKNNQDWIYRVPQQSCQENAAGATVHPLNHQLAAPFATGNLNKTWASLSLENVCWSFLSKAKRDQALLNYIQCPLKNIAPAYST